MSKARVELYTTGYCGYCRRAKSLLDSKGVPYEEIRVDSEPDIGAVLRTRGREELHKVHG